MKSTLLGGAAALALTAGMASAAGLDRSGQSVSSLFAPDGTLTTSFGLVMPDVTGEDRAGGGSYSDSVSEDYTVPSIAFTNSVGAFGYALIYDQPYGADINYGSDPATTRLGGTAADLNSHALTFVGRYKIGDRFSVFAGIGVERVDAEVTLNGQAYTAAIGGPSAVRGVAQNAGISPQLLGGALQGNPAAIAALTPFLTTNFGSVAAGLATLGGQVTAVRNGFAGAGGYQFEMEKSTKPTYLVGAAYEIEPIAMRIVGTYRFETQHSADTVETFGVLPSLSGDVDYVTPQSFNLEAQTGIAPGTLLTLGYRWTNFEAVDLIPENLGSDLVNLEDGRRYTIGLGRQFNEKVAGSVALIYEPEGDDLVSPLGPTNGLFGITLGGRYTDGNMSVTGGINYSWLGDATAEVRGAPEADFEDNHAIGLGFQASFKF